jgi:hypothetical protein
MGVNSLIPFGFHQESKKLVDVSGVSRGKNCGCFCSSCKAPLIAPQGKLKEWHFAHWRKSDEIETKIVCEYSFAVSVRLMIHQLALEGLSLHAPKYTLFVQDYNEKYCEYHQEEICVTEASHIRLANPDINAKFSKVNVDILSYVEGIPFIVYIKYKGRPVPSEINPPNIHKCGVVAIDISGLTALFHEEKEGRYLDVLRKFIEDNTEGKSWIYHPRAIKVRKELEAKMEQWLYEQNSLSPPKSIKPVLDISSSKNLPKLNSLRSPELEAQNY